MKSFFITVILFAHITNAVIEDSTIKSIIDDIYSGRYMKALENYKILPILIEVITPHLKIDETDPFDINSVLWLKEDTSHKKPYLVYTGNSAYYCLIGGALSINEMITSKTQAFTSNHEDFRKEFICVHDDKFSDDDAYIICPCILSYKHDPCKELLRTNNEEIKSSISTLFELYQKSSIIND